MSGKGKGTINSKKEDREIPMNETVAAMRQFQGAFSFPHNVTPVFILPVSGQKGEQRNDALVL